MFFWWFTLCRVFQCHLKCHLKCSVSFKGRLSTVNTQMVLSLLDLSSNSRTIGFCVNTFVRNEFFPNLSTFQTFFSFRVGRLKFCTSWPLHGHYSFCIVYGRVVYHSFIKHDTQKLRYIINFNVINVFSIYTICCFT